MVAENVQKLLTSKYAHKDLHELVIVKQTSESVVILSECTVPSFPSTPHTLSLFCCAVPARPVNVVVTPVSGSELSIAWTVPDQPPNVPPVLYYTVSWKEEGGAGGSHNISGPANTMYQIPGLAQGTQYTVTVTAHNSVGRSDTATDSETTFSVGEWSTRVHVPAEVDKNTQTLQSFHLNSPSISISHI